MATYDPTGGDTVMGLPKPKTATNSTNIAPSSTTQNTTGSANPAGMALRDWANQNKVNLNFDQGTGNIMLLNPSNNRAVSFANGQGSKYGVGGFNNGTNYVTNSDLLKNSLMPPDTSNIPSPSNNMPSNNAQSNYNAPQLKNNFNYDTYAEQAKNASNSSAEQQIALLKQAISNSKAKIQQQLGELPDQYNQMRGSTWQSNQTGFAGDRERLAAMGLADSGYRSTKENERQANMGNAMTQYDLSQQKDTRNLNDQLNQLNIQEALAESAIKNGASQQLAQNLMNAYLQNAQMQTDVDKYNAQLPFMTAGYTGKLGDTSTIQGLQSQSDLLTQALQRQGMGINNQAASTNLQYLPQQLQQGLNVGNQQLQQLTTQNQYLPQQLQLGIQGQSLQNQGQGLQNQQLGTQNQYLPQQLQQNLDLGAAQLVANKVDTQMKQFQLDKIMPAQYQQILTEVQSGNLDNAAKQIQNSYLPEKLKADIFATITNANASMVGANASATNAATNAGQLGLAQQEFKAKKDSGMYDKDLLGNAIKRDALESKQLDDAVKRLDSLYVTKAFDKNTLSEVPKIVGDPNQMRQSILGLGLNDNQTRALLSRYGLSTNPAK